jgi:ribosomal protein S6--L-glutamate ligase
MRFIALAGTGGWHIQDLARAAALRGDRFDAASWRDLSCKLDSSKDNPRAPVARCGQLVLDNADALLLRTMPSGSLEQIVFRMDLVQRLADSGLCVVNDPKAVEIAVDKHAASARLLRAGVPTPMTVVCQRLDDARAGFAALGGDVVLKPLFGSEGFGILRLSDPQLAERTFAALERMHSVIYMQRFVPHGNSDLRLLVIGDRVVAAMRRVSDSWRTNIACGAHGEPYSPDDATIDLALRASRACGTLIAGVDIMTDENTGESLVIEVNAVPGWRELTRVTGVDVASEVLAFVEARALESDRG